MGRGRGEGHIIDFMNLNNEEIHRYSRHLILPEVGSFLIGSVGDHQRIQL